MTNILATRLPLYQMRGFDGIIKEDNLILIDTYWDRYILDDKSLQGNLYDRRTHITLNKDDYSYKLYPLTKRCSTIGQVLHALPKGKHFLDEEGTLFKYVPEEMYTIASYEVKNAVLKHHNLYLLTIKVDTFTHINMLAPFVGNFVQLIDFKHRGFVLYDVVNEEVPSFKRKL